MYKCDICKHVSNPGAKLRKVTEYRADGSIAHETPVCTLCLSWAEASGLATARRVACLRKAQQTQDPAPVVVVQPAPPTRPERSKPLGKRAVRKGMTKKQETPIIPAEEWATGVSKILGRPVGVLAVPTPKSSKRKKA
jgi:hypothetical protein